MTNRRSNDSTREFPVFWRRHRLMMGLVVATLVLCGLLTLFSRFPQLAEKLYTRFFYAGLARVLSPLSAQFPFSLSEVAIYVAILLLLFRLVLNFKRRRFGKAALELLGGVAVIVLWFYFAWGFNYLRPPIEQQLDFAAAAPDSAALRENFLWCIDEANRRWQVVAPWDLSTLDNEIEKDYSSVFSTLNLPAIAGRWPPKFPLFPGLLDYTLTSGIFGPFFHEVHLNAHLLPVEMPFVLAHEKAHGRGFARESEASFIALLVCLRSPNTAIQYSAYFSLLGHCKQRYRPYADYDSLKQIIRPEITADFAAVWSRVEKYMGPVAEFSHKGYDVYLRANQVEGGAANYADVVDLVAGWRKAHKIE